MADRPAAAQLGEMITGYWISQAIYAASVLGIADELADGPRSIDELAQATSAVAERLYRLLRALASVGIFAEQEDGRFALTPLAEPLQSDHPHSVRALSLMMGAEQYMAWGRLAEAVRSHENAYEATYGKPVFDYLAEHPEKARIFDETMTGIHGRETGAVLDAYDFSAINVLADVGGGNGSNLIAILNAYPNMRGILYDLPHVVDRARPHFEAAGVADRCQFIGGSFFESVPSGADACLMRHIIHDWDDEKSLTILRHCHSALPAGGKLLVIESVIPPGNEPFGAKFLDLTMMLIPGGKERTEAEYRELYDQSGFDLTRIVPTGTEVSVVEGRRQ